MFDLVPSIERCIAEAVAGDHDYLEDLCMDGRPELWLQISWDTFNLALPGDELPAALGVLPEYVSFEQWEARSFLTISHDAHDPPELARFLLDVLQACWGVKVDAITLDTSQREQSVQSRAHMDAISRLQRATAEREEFELVASASHDFYELVSYQTMHEVQREYMAKYNALVIEISTALGQPSFNGGMDKPNFPEWYEAELLALWPGTPCTCYVALRHDDKELPFVLVYGCVVDPHAAEG